MTGARHCSSIWVTEGTIYLGRGPLSKTILPSACTKGILGAGNVVDLNKGHSDHESA